VVAKRYVDGRKMVEIVDRDSIALNIGNWQMVTKDRASFKQRLRQVMDQN
jgi:hypothetical protein